MLAARCGEKNVVIECASELRAAKFGNRRASDLPRGIAGREDSAASLERRKEMALKVRRLGERCRTRAKLERDDRAQEFGGCVALVKR